MAAPPRAPPPPRCASTASAVEITNSTTSANPTASLVIVFLVRSNLHRFDLEYEVCPRQSVRRRCQRQRIGRPRKANGQDQGEDACRRDGRGRDDPDHLAENP